MNKNRFFLGWLILQLVVLGGWAGIHEWQRQHGPRVFLKLAPVDPHDILRGRYQAIAFEVERVPKEVVARSSLGDGSKLEWGKPLWLVLQQGTNQWHEVASIHRDHPEGEEHVIRAQYANDWSDWDQKTETSVSRGLRVSLGMDRYFIPANHPDIPRGTNHVVLGEVSIGKSGNPQLERLLIDGKPY